MNRLDDIRLGDIARGLRRYQPFIGVVVAIVLLMAFLPGEGSNTDDDEDIAALLEGTDGQGGASGAGTGQGAGTGSGGGEEAGAGTDPAAAGGAGGSTAGG